MALTKLGYLRYAEPVEALYMNCSTQLIINIARHFLTGKGLSTAEWQLKKLSELQSLTSESIEIIAANTGRSHDEVARAFREVMGVGLADAEKVLAAAAKAGYLPPVPPIEDSVAMRNILQNYIAQADDTLNLVNTVMLQSTLDRYRYIIDDVVRIERLQGITAGSDLVTQLARTQGVLNTATANVVIGAESRTKALRDAIKQLSAQGITGWVDRGGHRWTAEAYVNMDIRTTVHNVAIEAQKERSAEYGVSTFQISTHSGARPLCAPYQGWICSWDNSAGTVTDLWGVVYQVHPINETSYGEAAGIFGVNCGHFPETFVDGFSVPRYNELTPEDEAKNALEYAESQQQRQIEREIRQAKTDAAALDAMGDKEGFKEAAAKVKEKQNEYKQFCESTGRTPRPDRTQVSTYGRSQSSKVTWSNRKNAPTPTATPKAELPKWENKDSLKDITAQLERFAESVKFSGISVENANLIGQTLNDLVNGYPTDKLRTLEMNGRIKSNARACGASLEISKSYVSNTPPTLWESNNEKILKSIENYKQYLAANYPESTRKFAQSEINRLQTEYAERTLFSRWSMSDSRSTADAKIRSTITHEYGHIIADQYSGAINKRLRNANVSDEAAKEAVALMRKTYKDAWESGDIYKLSKYGSTDVDEMFAESFAAYAQGIEIPKVFTDMVKEVLKLGSLLL